MRKIILIALTFLFVILSVKACTPETVEKDCGTMCVSCIEGSCIPIC